MNVRAAVLEEVGRPPPYAASQPLQVGEVELEQPGPGELLVRVEAAGVCHSDLSDGNRPRPVPLVLGHEASGVVEAVGGAVSHVRAGDHVVLPPALSLVAEARILAGYALAAGGVVRQVLRPGAGAA